jgi:hypothetical protein
MYRMDGPKENPKIVIVKLEDPADKVELSMFKEASNIVKSNMKKFHHSMNIKKFNPG